MFITDRAEQPIEFRSLVLQKENLGSYPRDINVLLPHFHRRTVPRSEAFDR